MGGETISLAAAEASLDKVANQPVTQTLRDRGSSLMDGLAKLIERHGAGRFMRLSGHPSWSFVTITDCDGAGALEIKTLWLQEMFKRGILIIGTHNMSYAHTP